VDPHVENNARTRGGGVTGKGWRKGQSGNPSGRPKGLAKAVRDLPVELGRGDGSILLARFWWDIIDSDEVEHSLQLQASKLLADRGWGKAPEFVPIEDADPLQPDPEEADRVLAALNAALDEIAQRRRAASDAAAPTWRNDPHARLRPSSTPAPPTARASKPHSTSRLSVSENDVRSR
jgi:hypothetical protein